MVQSTSNHIWRESPGQGPIVATSIHAGHAVRDEVAALLALDDASRLREEDPYTDEWTAVAPTRFVGLHSRFEVDLNRPREKAVYLGPEDAWGLHVWKSVPPPALIDRSLASYDAFYDAVRERLAGIESRHGRFFLFDLHTYNHRRDGAHAPPADGDANPQVNVGTGTMDRSRWGAVVDRFLADLRGYDFPGGRLDVRENVKFRGGNFPRWVHETFPETGCAPAIEFKKFFMDEWNGEPDRMLVAAIRDALQSTVAGVVEELERS